MNDTTTKPVLSDEEFFCLEGCGTYKQYYEMRERFESDICPFCQINHSINNVLWEEEHWRLWANAFANDRGCTTMLVIASVPHWRDLTEISRAGWAELYDVFRFAENAFDLSGGMLFMRFGDMQKNAGTVPHLHFNLWVPDETKEVKVPIYKDPTNRAANKVRARDFAKVYEAGLDPDA